MAPIVTMLKTKRGKDALGYKGHIYTFHSSNAKRTRSYWRCELRSMCNARLTTNFAAPFEVLKDGTSDHQHQPSNADIAVREVVGEIRRKAADDPGVPPGAIIRAELRDIDDPEVQIQLPERPALRRMVNRAQNLARPGMPATLADIDILHPYDRTSAGDRFLHFDSGAGDEDRILIFTTKENLRILCSSVTLFADGTFKTVPNMFLQMYSLHGEFRENIFPLAFCLTARKNEHTYRRIYREMARMCEEYHFVLNPSVIMQDFELAAMNAARATFPEAQIKGCLFHFSQAIWRKVANAGLRKAFIDEDDSTIRDHFRELVGLAFVPLDEVQQRFEEVTADMDPVMEPITRYMETTYVLGAAPARRRVRRGRNQPPARAPPRFPPSTWNVHDAVLNHRQRTNNHEEAWHAHFQRIVVAYQLNMWRFIDELKKEQHDGELKTNQLLGGHRRVKDPVPAVYWRNHEAIERMVAKYNDYVEEGRIKQYLRGISYRLKVNTAVIVEEDEE